MENLFILSVENTDFSGDCLWMAISLILSLILLPLVWVGYRKRDKSRRDFVVATIISIAIIVFLPLASILDYRNVALIFDGINESKIYQDEGVLTDVKYSSSSIYNVYFSDGRKLRMMHNEYCYNFFNLSGDKSFINFTYVKVNDIYCAIKVSQKIKD